MYSGLAKNRIVLKLRFLQFKNGKPLISAISDTGRSLILTMTCRKCEKVSYGSFRGKQWTRLKIVNGDILMNH
jgi:hypothetical protein